MHMISVLGRMRMVWLEGKLVRTCARVMPMFRPLPQAWCESRPPTIDSLLPAPPPRPQASTSLSLKATAGLRLLPGTKAQDILEAVKAFFADYPFKVKSDAVAILDGECLPA
jgi:apyrase